MKRCPKCNRTFPDDNQKFCTFDGGLLVIADKPFDPNATVHGSSADLNPPPAGEPDFGETIATSSSAPTVIFPKDTAPTGSTTSGNVLPPPTTPPPASAPPKTPPPPSTAPPKAAATPSASTAIPQAQRPTQPPLATAPAGKRSKLPLILGILAILLLLIVGGVVAAFFLVVKPRLGRLNATPPVIVKETPPENVNSNANTNGSEPKAEESEFVAPPDTSKFTNARANLDGKLAEHYFDFSFYYPNNWELDPKAGVPGASNFAKVERRLPPDFTQENFAVGWYTSKGTYAADEATFPQLVEALGASLAKGFPDYQKVSEGPTKVNSLEGYEFRFTSVSKGSEKGDIQLWGRVIFLPPGVEGEATGATLVMLATSLAPELSGVEDVGERGQMPVILESFRLGTR
jgi:hypothetical protein